MDQYFHKIVNYLYLGNSRSLEYHNFDMIVNCTKENDIPFPIHYNPLCIRIPIKDEPSEYNKLLTLLNNTNVLEEIHKNIENKKEVLVHCFMGQQRSCAVVACYLIKYYNLTPQEAIDFIKLKRPIAFFGNVNFLQTIEFFYQNPKLKNHIS
jgi:protein-tyrosine phosphatase